MSAANRPAQPPADDDVPAPRSKSVRNAGRPEFRGRRHGRPLRLARRTALAEDMGPYGLHLSEAGTVQPGSLPQPCPRLWLEVGIGNGEHLLAQAARRPDILLLGCDPFIPGVAKCLAERRVQGLENIRVWPDDARLLLDALPDASLDRAFVLYPDPWPKRRHATRRFIQPASLDRLARTLVAGAELRLATDDPALADWMLWQTRRHAAFAWQARRAADWRTPPADWVETRYQAKTGAEGRPPIILIFTRR